RARRPGDRIGDGRQAGAGVLRARLLAQRRRRGRLAGGDRGRRRRRGRRGALRAPHARAGGIAVATAGGNWTARISSALCRASRWLSAASLVLVLCAFAIAARGARRGAFALAALGLVVALGAVQIYL